MDLSELKALWKEHDFRPIKRFGQNFLIDRNVRDNILKRVTIDANDVVVEIGPGFGVMSFDIADMCKKLYAVEKDKKICAIMKPLFRAKKNISLISKDILEIDLAGFREISEKIIVYGNIPYNITTPIIQNIIDNRACVKRAVLVMQDEYAGRLTAHPGSKDYGSISCYVQFYTRVKKFFRIGKNSFYPTPKVDSRLLSMEILPEPSIKVRDEHLMFRIIRQAFSQRRKKVLNPLSHDMFLDIARVGWGGVFEASGVDPALRAEDLPLTDYAKISDVISAGGVTGGGE
ncbi:MAG: ribosomal RNA small subunit methyltransferase A [Candidatus Omnitrophica bacterium]|nr:ribosomal RNA small subunit methyltransferase A [Candidatus Omnitrophota bacterium]MBU1127519.1 ribosomal RNA small subunit methyltransferase A [Candidatus Omnitrophota bacterium]MBU1657318.1 ribosomal RNA small subunit methyltransferase A [Candidatus Omnitrophota bacterium]MBU1783811.1 ribosomal RNA small subunit methyltransferase A [Candidatus Omnitrophota bacterium]MBU1851412.1 ribosomal RNA small subunit methyltransferase A [Candidatus Omnitrophota bacterium]